MVRRSWKTVVAEFISQSLYPPQFNRRRRQFSLARLSGSQSLSAEVFEDRILLTGDSGYGGYGCGPSVSSISFSITEFGYGSAVGELDGPIAGGSGSDGMYFLEVDYWNDGTVDYTDETLNDVSSIWAELTLPYTHDQPNDTMPIAVRLTETPFATNESAIGDWYVGNIAVLPPANAAPVVSGLSYTPWDLGYGLSGYLSGDIADATPEFGSYQLQIDSNGDGNAEFTLENSDLDAVRTAFLHEYLPVAGPQTVNVRVVETDVNTGEILPSGWASLSFTPALPFNERPEIDYLACHDNGYGGSSGYGSYGTLSGEFRDYTREESSYELEIDSNGDNYPDNTSSPGWLEGDSAFFIPGIDGTARVRIKEADIFGQERVSDWVAVGDLGQENQAPTASNQQKWMIVSSFYLQNSQILGTWTADDENALEYSIQLGQPTSPAIKEQVNAAPMFSIDRFTGEVTVNNAENLIERLKADYKVTFTVTATDGNQSVSYGVTLYEDYEPYLEEIRGHINSWRQDMGNLATASQANARAAVGKIDANLSLEQMTGTVIQGFNFVWAAAAYGNPPLAGHISVAAVAMQILVAAIGEEGNRSHASIVNEMEHEFTETLKKELILLSDMATAEHTALGALIAQITVRQNNMFVHAPDQQARMVVEYFAALQQRLYRPEPLPIPEVNDIYGELLLQYVRVHGWSIIGSKWRKETFGDYWGVEFNLTIIPPLGVPVNTTGLIDPQLVMIRDELNAIGYTRGGRYAINWNRPEWNELYWGF